MATSYTSNLHDDMPQSFEQFVLNCSRAFGALITMRDEPSSAPVPTHFEPNIKYHAKALAQAEKQRKRVLTKTLEQAERSALSDWKRAKKHREQSILSGNDVRYRYEDMLQSVKRWNPPTDDHVELKNFMIDQLEGSINFDAPPAAPLAEPVSGEQWLEDQLDRIDWSIAYHRKQIQGEIDRAKSRTDWVQALFTSLGIETSDEPVPVQ